MIWVLAFLTTPGLFVMMHVAFGWEQVVAHSPAMIETLLAQLAALFVTHSMVSTGFLAVLVWEGLTFDRDDAMVLGPLPVRGGAVVLAKLSALAAFLVGTSVSVNLATAIPFSLITGNHLGAHGVILHFMAHLAATVGGATFVFAAIVSIRGVLTLAVGSRRAAGAGSLLQFVFVGILLWFLVAVPSAMSTHSAWVLKLTATAWLPTAWFLGVFQHLLGSSRPEFDSLAGRAFIGMGVALAGAVLVTLAGYRRQMHGVLAPDASVATFAPVRITVTIARWLAGGDAAARGIAEFIILTIARNRAQQSPIAINAAVGVAVVVAALSMHADDVPSLMRPRTLVLWIPLVMAYWLAVGVRAAFFVPVELRGGWAFAVNSPGHGTAYWSAIRGAMIAYVLPRTLAVSLIVLVPLLGWTSAVSHTVLVGALTTLLLEALAFTIEFVPFTCQYEPGHAKLRTRWPLYALGLYLFAYWPAHVSMRTAVNPVAIALMTSAAALAIVVIELLGRRLRTTWGARVFDERLDDPAAPAALNLASVALRE